VKIMEGTCKGDAQVCKPTLLVLAPAILDKVFVGLQLKMKSASPVVQKLFAMGLVRATSVAAGRAARRAAAQASRLQAGGCHGPLHRPQWHWPADRLPVCCAAVSCRAHAARAVGGVWCGAAGIRCGSVRQGRHRRALLFQQDRLQEGAGAAGWERQGVHHRLRAARAWRAKVCSDVLQLPVAEHRSNRACLGSAVRSDGRWLAPWSLRIRQGYGLTETCASSCIGEVFDNATGQVGTPTSCTCIKLRDWPEGGYQLADAHDPNIGMPRGEILIGGAMVSQGYLVDPSDPDPDVVQKNKTEFEVDIRGIRFFCTGDIGQITASHARDIDVHSSRATLGAGTLPPERRVASRCARSPRAR
jgi:hypothetical protein